MPVILGGIAILIVAAYAANITGNADTVGLVLLATPFVVPVGAFVLWLVLTVLRFIFVRSSKR